jgi:hypothetical protein
MFCLNSNDELEKWVKKFFIYSSEKEMFSWEQLV